MDALAFAFVALMEWKAERIATRPDFVTLFLAGNDHRSVT